MQRLVGTPGVLGSDQKFAAILADDPELAHEAERRARLMARMG
jgi:hypothetical protein